MYFKNAIKGLYRTPLKSLLLIMLLGITACIWELGMSTYVDIESFLKECDDLYVTLGELEYVTPDHISEIEETTLLDEAMRSEMIDKISQDNSVLFAEESKEYFCNIENYKRTDSNTAAKNKAVLVLTGIIYQEDYNRYQARVKECLFAHKDMTGETLLISAREMEFDEEKEYVIYADVYTDVSPMNYLIPSNYMELQSGKEIAMASTIENDTIPEDYIELAGALEVKDNGIALIPTRNIDSLHLFHQNILYMEEGREFTKEEYDAGEKVCIINGIVAKRLGKEIGDQINLSWLNGGEFGFWNSYWPKTGFDQSETYEIVGITNQLNVESYKVYVPYNSNLFVDGMTMDSEVLRVIIDNRMTAEYVEEVRESMGDHYRFSVYDQGYAETVSAYISIQKIARIIVGSVSILCLATILLIAYISIVKQRETLITMLRLGAKKNQVVRYSLYSGTILGFLGVLLGTILAILSRGRVYEWIEKTADENFKIDFRFSDFNQSMQRKMLNFHLETEPRVFITFLLIFLLILFIVVYIFAVQFSKSKMHGKHREHTRELTVRKHLYMRSGSGFACKQIIRNKSRSFAILFLATAVTIFLGELLVVSSTSSENLENLLQKEEIRGVLVDYNGNSNFNLLYEIEDMKELTNISDLKSVEGMTSENYLFAGVSADKNGEAKEYEPIQIPKGFEGFTVLRLQFLEASELVFTTSLDNTQEFFYVKDFDASYLEGYDESFLGKSYDGELCGMISETMAREKNIELGETIVVSPLRSTGSGFLEYHIKVIGIFHSGFAESNIYCPLDAVLDTSFLRQEKDAYDGVAYGEEREEYRIKNIMIGFDGIKNISMTKDELTEIGFEEVHTAQSNRKYILLDDGVALSNLNGLRMQDQYIRILMVLMIALCAAANIFFATVLVRSEKSKIAIMLSYGANIFQIYIAFCLGLILLYLLGSAIGILIVQNTASKITGQNILVLVIIGLCFVTGSSVTLFKITRGKIAKHIKTIDE